MSATRVGFKILNLNEFHGVMQKLGKSVGGATLENAGMEAGKVIELQAKLNVNARFSSNQRQELAGSIHTVVAEKSQNKVRIHVGTGSDHARIHELGGLIKPVFAKFLHFVVDGVEVFTKLVQMPARPFLRPAATEGYKRAGIAAGEVFKEAIREVKP